MSVTRGTRVVVSRRWREVYGLTHMASVTDVDDGGYYVRDDAGTESFLERDEFTPLP